MAVNGTRVESGPLHGLHAIGLICVAQSLFGPRPRSVPRGRANALDYLEGHSGTAGKPHVFPFSATP